MKNIDVIMKECYKQDQENSTKTRIFQKELDKIIIKDIVNKQV